jgi:O-antigen/teichoic acid export membrane protein
LRRFRRKGARAGAETSLLHNFLVTALGSAGSQLLTFAALPLLSRIYAPAEFGIWALFMSAAFAVPVLAGLRYEIAIVIARTDATAILLQHAIFLISLGTALLWCAGLYLVSVIAHQTGLFEVQPIYYLIAVMIVANAVFQPAQLWWTRKHQFNRLAVARILLSTVTVGLQLLLGLFHNLGGQGLIWGTIAGQTVLSGYALILMVCEDNIFSRGSWDIRHFRATLWRYRRMPLYAAPYTLQGQAFMQSIVAVLGYMGSPALAGRYAVSQRTVYYPMTIISQSLSQAVLPRMSNARARLKEAEPFFSEIIGLFLLLLTPLYALLLVYSEPLAAFVLGEAWRPAGPMMAWLFLPSMLLVSGSWFERIFDVLDRQRVQLVLELSFNAATLIALVTAMRLLPHPETSVLVLSIGLAAYYIAWLVTAFHIASLSMAALARAFAKGLIAFGAWLGALIGSARLGTPLWAIAILLAVAGIYYAVLVRRSITALKGGLSPVAASEG